jgi:hypothetical protein
MMVEQRYAEACEKFAQSQELEAQVGTLMNLALCHEQVGKLATAYLEYNDALALSLRASDTARVILVRQRLAVLEPRLARVTITVEEPKTSPGLWVKLDGVSLGSSAFNMPIPVDLGRHEVEAGAHGKLTVRIELQVDKAGTVFPARVPALVEMPLKFTDPNASRARARVITSIDEATESTPAAIRSDDGHRGNSRASMIAGASIGVAAVATLVGTYFGIDAFSQWDVRNRHCTSQGCDEEAVRAKARAERSARMANLCLATGLVAAGIGLYVVVTADSKSADPTPKGTAKGHGSATMLYVSGAF